MSKKRVANHPPPGQITAIAALGLQEDKHLSECKPCDKIYASVRSFITSDIETKLNSLKICPSSPEEEAYFIAYFLGSGLPREVVTPFLRHINDCYACFALFFQNWNAYLKTKNKRDVEGNDGN